MTFFDGLISMYVFMFDDFNVCTEDLKKGGIIPEDGTSPYTLVEYNYFILICLIYIRIGIVK